MKIGFLYNKQKEIEAEKKAKEYYVDNRAKINNEQEKAKIATVPKKQPKKIKANLEALKK